MTAENLQQFRQKRIQAVMRQNNIDILVASLPEHILYLTGFCALGATYHAKTQAYAVYCPGQPFMLVNSMVDAPTAIDALADAQLFCYGPFRFAVDHASATAGILEEKTKEIYPSAAQALTAALKKLGEKPLRIAVDELRTPIQTWDCLREAFPQHTIVPGLSLFESARKIKHPDEIALLEHAAVIAEDSLLAMLERVKVGDSEWDMDRRYREEVARRDGNGYFITATVDRRSSYSDTASKPEQKVQDGSVMRFDYGATYRFFCSDLARTVLVGTPNRQAESLYAYILDGIHEIENKIKPGVLVSEAFQTGMAAVRKGIPDYYRQHVGHGIGLLINDNPTINGSTDTPFEENMVLCLETPYYLYDRFGIQVEYMVAVTKDGVRRLTHTSDALMYIPAR